LPFVCLNILFHTDLSFPQRIHMYSFQNQKYFTTVMVKHSTTINKASHLKSLNTNKKHDTYR